MLTCDNLFIEQVAYLWRIPGLVINFWRSEADLEAVFKIIQWEAPEPRPASPGGLYRDVAAASN